MRLSIIVPIYNEEGNIRPLFDEIFNATKHMDYAYEVIAVNDGSRDNSINELIAVQSEHKSLKIVDLAGNYGQTAAIMCGLDSSKGKWVILMDGDGQNDPSDIQKLIDHADTGFDVVSGWRKNRQDNYLSRVFVSNVANKIISFISNVHLNDYGCTLKIYNRSFLLNTRLYGEMHRFIPIYAAWRGARVGEIEVNHRPRIHGESKYGLDRVIKVILDIVVIKFLQKYFDKPIHFFGGVGLFIILLSFGILGYALMLKFFEGRSLILTPLPLLAGLTFLSGLICIFMGILAEMISRTYFEHKKGATYIVNRIIEG